MSGSGLESDANHGLCTTRRAHAHARSEEPPQDGRSHPEAERRLIRDQAGESDVGETLEEALEASQWVVTIVLRLARAVVGVRRDHEAPARPEDPRRLRNHLPFVLVGNVLDHIQQCHDVEAVP